MKSTYVASGPAPEWEILEEDIRFLEETPGIVGHGEMEVRDGRIRVPIKRNQRGRAYVDLKDREGNDLGVLADAGALAPSMTARPGALPATFWCLYPLRFFASFLPGSCSGHNGA